MFLVPPIITHGKLVSTHHRMWHVGVRPYFYIGTTPHPGFQSPPGWHSIFSIPPGKKKHIPSKNHFWRWWFSELFPVWWEYVSLIPWGRVATPYNRLHCTWRTIAIVVGVATRNGSTRSWAHNLDIRFWALPRTLGHFPERLVKHTREK